MDLPVDATNRTSAVATTSDAGKLAFGQGQVQVVEVASKKVLLQIAGANARVTSLAMSGDGTLLVVGLESGAVQIHRLAPRAEKLSEGSHHRGAVTAVAAGGQGFASADDSGQIVLWGKNGQKQGVVNVGARGVKALLFLGDRAVAAGCGDGSVKIVDTSSGAAVATHNVASAAITALVFARDKLALAIGTQSGQVSLLALEA